MWFYDLKLLCLESNTLCVGGKWMDLSENLYAGRKTFFIAPDVTLLPEYYLEEDMNHGYESYIISDDRTCAMSRKVELLISMFPQSILFFYIDAKLKSKAFINRLCHLS